MSDAVKPPALDAALSRRALLAGAAAAAGGALIAAIPAGAQHKTASAATPPAIPADPTKAPGAPTTAVGTRSPFFDPQRAPVGEITGTSLTPLQDLTGTITPSDLHFTRVHAGVPTIDPAKHTLLIHGLVDRPIEFTVADLKRFPAVTRTHFLECSGNGRSAYRTPTPNMTPQQVCGMTSNTEWTGVPLATLFHEAGVKRDAKWFLAEGGDACLLARSVPVSKALDDALVVYGQNGEALRPEQGFPIRLLLPGYEGNMNVKWVRRFKLATDPFMTRWETSKYTDPLPGGKIRYFSFELDANSLITSPAFPEKLGGKGWWPITGLAWSGRGRISRVDVSVDGGKTWVEAELLSPLLPKAHVRFQHMWEWTGNESLLMSRSVDDQGYTQPTYAQLKTARGPGTDYHFNPIRAWRVAADGTVTFEAAT
ncbi:MAG TPA: sulfite dehydrogenase [Gemmatimonadaceae bacterium]|jgi:sulfane dehydrogenase subunit SoxC|nr:sulfite dehydrogenase [Gemmatimonadaceae bacterium]